MVATLGSINSQLRKNHRNYLFVLLSSSLYYKQTHQPNMFSKISDRFHKSNESKAKLLNFKEFDELDKPIKKQHFRGFFRKHQAGARKISQELHQKETPGPPSSIYGRSSSSIYSEVVPANSNNLSPATEETYILEMTESCAFKNNLISFPKK